MCLDVLRALGKAPEAALAALAAELAPAAALDARFARHVEELGRDMLNTGEAGGRRLAERLVIAVQGALLLRHAPPFIAEAFVASRIAQDVGGAFGRLPSDTDFDAILARALAA